MLNNDVENVPVKNNLKPLRFKVTFFRKKKHDFNYSQSLKDKCVSESSLTKIDVTFRPSKSTKNTLH